jgi:ATP-dependent helicase HrpB
MVLRAISLQLGLTACRVAALLGERDVFRLEASSPLGVDIRHRLEVFDGGVSQPGVDVDQAALRRVRAEAEHLARQIGIGQGTAEDPNEAGLLIALAYPDRIAQRRHEGARGRYLLRNGRGAAIDGTDPLGSEALIAIAAVDDRLPESRVFLAAPLSRAELDAHFANQFVDERVVAWDEAAARVVARRRVRLGAILLRDELLRDVEPNEVADAFAAALATAGVDALPWSEGARRLRERLAFLHGVDPSWPDVSEQALAASVQEWLAPRIIGMRRRADLATLDLGAALLDRLTWSQRAAIDDLAPTHFVAPSGSRVPISYADPAGPVLAVRLQEMFGLADTPRIAGGRVPLTLHLLSPAQRPVQVTRDLAGFWRASYFDVQREMRGRYPKHDWPDDPLSATPTARAKRRRHS